MENETKPENEKIISQEGFTSAPKLPRNPNEIPAENKKDKNKQDDKDKRA